MFASILIIFLLAMISGLMFAMRVAGLAEDKSAHNWSKLYYIPARIFFLSFPVNLLVAIWHSIQTDFKFWDAIFYVVLIIFIGTTWTAKMLRKNAIQYVDAMPSLKKGIILSLFFYMIFWITREIIIVIINI